MISTTLATNIIPLRPGIGEAAEYMILGFLVVMVVLASIWGLTSLIGQYFVIQDKAQKAKKAQAAAQAAVHHDVVAAAAAAAMTTPATAGGVTPELLAIISAAVQAVVKEPARIVAINPSGNWGAEGRRQIFDSHRLR